jgi:adenylosuccinate synthase
MPVTVVVGGQYGSEGKGKVAHFLAKEMNASVAIRCGGSNSGHTVIDSQGNPLIFRQLPTASILPDVVCVLCAGSYLDPEVLLPEIKIASLEKSRLFIDPHAVIITPEIRETEQKGNLVESIGSTGSGTGEAIIRRIKRSTELLFAKDLPELAPYIKDTKGFLRKILSKRERVILEGTQGYGLSLLHSPHYPYVTSRDTTAAAFVSEAGISPIDVDDVVLTIRAFPIRVAGNSGPL